MAKDREIACIYYLCETQCVKGREGTFNHKCQTCSLYRPRKGGRPRHKDLRREKLDKLNKDKRSWDSN